MAIWHAWRMRNVLTATPQREHPALRRSPRRRVVLARAACLIALSLMFPRVVPGQDKEESAQERASRQRLEVMQQALADFVVRSDAITDEPALRFVAEPLLRYNDSTREFFDAGVWRLGGKGRPTALVTLELYRTGEDQTFLTYEFITLTEHPFSMTARRAQWQATPTDVAMTRLETAPKPAENATTRLLQMKQLARQFTVNEEHGKNRVECRLMPRQLDRYDDKGRNIVDGAIFVFANGTNPEMGLALECDAEGWSYGFIRMAAAKLNISLSGEPLTSLPAFRNYGSVGPYQATRHTVNLPAD